MASDFNVCNDALAKIGAEAITSLSDSNKRARLCNQFYDKRRLSLLSNYQWPFAKKQAESLTASTDPLFGYSNAFVLPSDCLRVLSMKGYSSEPTVGRTDWKEKAGLLHTHASDPTIEYIFDESTVDNFSEQFYETLVAVLAHDLAFPLIGSVSLKREMKDDMTRILKDARSIESQRGEPEQLNDHGWLDARHGTATLANTRVFND